MMRILVLGGDGMLGHKVFQVLSGRFETFAAFKDPKGPWIYYPMYEGSARRKTITGIDAMDFKTIESALKKINPDVVINCIGIIKQLKEAENPLISIAINSLFPHQLANFCCINKIRMFHISTDCVFSGNKGNYTEDDIPDAKDLYGRTKFLGEVKQPGCFTVRTSLVGRDFVKNISLLEWFLSQKGKKIKGYARAIYTGLTTQSLANIIGNLIVDYPELWGVYQIASKPISKYDLLVKIRDAMKLNIEIEPYDGFSKDLSLDASRFLKATGYKIPAWDEMIKDLAGDKTPYDERRTLYEQKTIRR